MELAEPPAQPALLSYLTFLLSSQFLHPLHFLFSLPLFILVPPFLLFVHLWPYSPRQPPIFCVLHSVIVSSTAVIILLFSIFSAHYALSLHILLLLLLLLHIIFSSIYICFSLTMAQKGPKHAQETAVCNKKISAWRRMNCVELNTGTCNNNSVHTVLYVSNRKRNDQL